MPFDCDGADAAEQAAAGACAGSEDAPAEVASACGAGLLRRGAADTLLADQLRRAYLTRAVHIADEREKRGTRLIPPDS